MDKCTLNRQKLKTISHTRHSVLIVSILRTCYFLLNSIPSPHKVGRNPVHNMCIGLMRTPQGPDCWVACSWIHITRASACQFATVPQQSYRQRKRSYILVADLRFPRKGCQTQRGAPTYYLAFFVVENCMEMKYFWPSPPPPPPRPSRICPCIFFSFQHKKSKIFLQ